MEAKKNELVDTNQQRMPFTINGFLFMAGLTLASFSYKTYDIVDKGPAIEDATNDKENDEEEVKKPEEKTPPPPPPPTAVVMIAQVNMAQEITEETKTTKDSSVDEKLDIGTQGAAQSSDSDNTTLGAPEGVAMTEEPIEDVPDQDAVFPGNVKEYLAKNIVYPEISKENNDEGVVWVNFVVEKDGSLSNVSIPKDKSLTPELDREAINKIKAMPKWTPGESNGRKVRSRFKVKVSFKLA